MSMMDDDDVRERYAALLEQERVFGSPGLTEADRLLAELRMLWFQMDSMHTAQVIDGKHLAVLDEIRRKLMEGVCPYCVSDRAKCVASRRRCCPDCSDSGHGR